MEYFYLRINFYKTLNAKFYPKIECRKLKDWNGEKGDYKDGKWVCYKSYLNHVIYNDDRAKDYQYYEYGMVIFINQDDYNTIINSVKFAFEKVKEYIDIENKERELVFNRYQEFLDNGGFPLRS
jgi:hypothetical protein